MSPSHKERTSKAQKRQAILQAAWKLIRHYGYGKTTIDDIAQQASIGKGTIYLHFRSKADIMLALVELTNERITSEIAKIAAGSGPPDERLHACLLHRVMTLFDLVHKYPHSADVVSTMLPEIVERLDSYVKRHGEILSQLVSEGRDAGLFIVREPRETGNLLAGLFELLTPPYYRFSTRRELEEFATRVFQLTIDGIRNNTAAGTSAAAGSREERSP